MLIITDGNPRGLGYFEIDQRAAGIPVGTGTAVHFEADTYTCSHCQAVVVMNPERKRARYKCYGCNHHICDNCAAEMASGAQCVPFAKKVEDYFEQLARQTATNPEIMP